MPGPVLLYLLFVAVATIAILPAARRVFGDVRRVPLVSVGVTIGVPLALLVFSLVARVATSYALAVPLTLVALVALWAWGGPPAAAAPGAGRGTGIGRLRPDWDLRSDAVLLGVYSALLAAILAIRSGWPSIFWDHDFAHVGSEKLFNFSLIQAFLFGQGYPPENLWLAGERIDYYVLLHALPGLVAWAWRVLTGDPTAGAQLFLFSDVFLLVLGSLALSAWTQALLASGESGLPRRQALALGMWLGIGVLLATHAEAVRLVLAASVGGEPPAWWFLEREVVRFTYSQYPFYLVLLGDHHAFQHVFFLQVALYGAVALLLLAPRLHWPRVLLAGALAAAVLMSHSGSVLLDLVVFGIAAVVLAVLRLRRGERLLLRAHALNLAATAGVALLLALPALWRGSSPSISWYWVSTRLASPLSGFLSAQAGPLALFGAACAAGVVAARRAARGDRLSPHGWGPWAAGAVVVALAVSGRPGAAVAAAGALLVLRFAPWRSSDGRDRAPLVILGAAVFAVWLLPEFVVGDFAHRPVVDWKRWNLVMRFWLEGYYLVPFLAVVAFGPAWRAALASRGFVRALTVASMLVGALWLAVHAYSVGDRRARTPDLPGRDSTAFLAREHPCDAAIVGHLQRLAQPVRIGELCGTAESIPEVPLDYGWAGRIAAFSGRPGICGWSRHVRQFSPRLRDASVTGPVTWERFRAYERQLRQVYLAAERHMPDPESRAFLDRLGVTHVVLGEQENLLFPALSGQGLADALGGAVEFERGQGCAVVRLGPDSPGE